MTIDFTQHRKAIVIGLVALSIILAFAFLLTSLKKPASTSTTATPSPDVVTKGSNMPTYAGFDSLIEPGVSTDQIDALKYAFYKYSKSTNRQFKEVSLNTKSILVTPHDRFSETTTDTIVFAVSIDTTTYSARLEYSGFSAIKLILRDLQTSALVYDSGTIDLYNGIGNE